MWSYVVQGSMAPAGTAPATANRTPRRALLSCALFSRSDSVLRRVQSSVVLRYTSSTEYVTENNAAINFTSSTYTRLQNRHSICIISVQPPCTQLPASRHCGLADSTLSDSPHSTLGVSLARLCSDSPSLTLHFNYGRSVIKKDDTHAARRSNMTQTIPM